MKPISALAAALFLFTALMPHTHAAQETVRVNATIVVASNDGKDYDLVNDDFRDELIKLFSYSSYRQADALAITLSKSERTRVELPGGYELLLTLQGTENNRVLVQAVIRKENLQHLDTVLSILKPGVVFVGGPKTPEGGDLIIILETGF